MRREHFIPLIAGILVVAFSMVSLLVFLTHGRSAYLIRRKLKLGALILSLTAAAAMTGCDRRGPTTTCYLPALDPENEITLHGTDQSGRVVLNLDEANEVFGIVEYRQATVFSFVVMKSGDEEFQRGAVLAQDGTYDAPTEEIHFSIDSGIAPGEYYIIFYDCSVESISDGEPLSSVWPLVIVGTEP